MKRLFYAFFALFLSVGVMMPDAEAKRFGGGKSSGMQRSVPTRDASPQRQADRPAQSPQQAAPAPAQPKRNWLGPLAGLAAGIGLAALFSHLGMGEGMANFAMLALLAVAVFAVIGFFMRRMRPAQPAPAAAQYAGGQAAPVAYQPQGSYGGASNGSSAGYSAATFPADFDEAAFVRSAKLNFVRLQAAYDAANLDDLREFTSPEMFAEIKLQIAERNGAANNTDVVSVEAVVLDYVQEARRDIASVRFHGLIRETAEGTAEAFDETWHLTKANDGRAGWVVAGIEQNR
ncbi:Tim44-like domain-containing protein [Chitinimonas sp.]|uniref:Tim44 domain-containing protein n=1 Tax=Chitinimonas sp. TaxID=1934313 RepID=UPI002F92D496